MSSILADEHRRRRAALLLAIAITLITLWQTRLGSLLLYPFTILATWFHEIGHGLAGIVTGARFERLLIFSNGSGVAEILTPVDGSRLTVALVAASGPLGPAIAGALLIIAARNPGTTRVALAVLGSALIISTLVWVRSLTGLIVLPALGVAILALARRGAPSWQRLGVQVLGVQACISAWQQFGYLFSAGGSIGGRLHRSDTAAIADAFAAALLVVGHGHQRGDRGAAVVEPAAVAPTLKRGGRQGDAAAGASPAAASIRSRR